MNRGGPRLAVQWAALAAATALVWLSGRGALAAPPVWHPADLAGWWTGRGPILATFSAVRATLGCVGIYLTLLWAAALVAPGRIARALRPRVSRLPGGRWLAASLVGAAGFVSTPATGYASTPPAPPPPQMTYLGPATDGGQSLPTAGPPTPSLPAAGPTTSLFRSEGPAPSSHHAAEPTTLSPPATKRPSPSYPAARPPRPSAPAGGATATAPPATKAPASSEPTSSAGSASGLSTAPPAAAAGAVPTAGPPPTAAPPAAASEWVVRPGDDLWSIAAAALTASHGRAPTVGEIAAYWEQVLASNRSRLPDPDNPNLIFPGDRIELPPP